MGKAEDSLIADLDALEVSKGPEPMTCRFWREASLQTLDAVVRNVRRLGHTPVYKHLKSKGIGVTPDGIREHAAGKCPKCQA